MRIPGWLLGLLGFITLIGATLLCSAVTYSQVRQVVIDLWGSGVEVESPGEVVNAVLGNTDAFPTRTPFVLPTQEAVVVLPSITPQSAVANASTPEPTTDASVSPTTETNAVASTPIPEPTLDPLNEYSWNDPRQVRILLLGIDQRIATGETGPFRTDTMIVLNIDPARKTAGMISFPRDLWVDIPNYVGNRINTANALGDADNYPGGGGPRLAMETITSNFGIRIDHYVLINFDVFERVVNTIAPNGVEVCIDEAIYDPKYPDDAYGTIVVEFQTGCQSLNATQLLQYARTRATQGGDFDRARRQQRTLDALRAHVLSAGGVTTFITQIPTLWQELANSYRTSLTLNEIIALGRLMSEIDRNSINFGVINADYVQLGKGPTGEDVLYPEYGRITGLVQRIFYPQIQLTRADLLERSKAENATIRVYNGTDVQGLAGRTQEWLTVQGVNVASVGNDPNHGGDVTVIRDYGNNRWTAEYLASVMGISIDRIEPGTDGLAADGIIIVAGSDIQQIIGGQP